MDQPIIILNEDDTRQGLTKWLEVERLHEQLHVAESDFNKWANAMGRIYNVPDGYVISDPTLGFVPRPEELKHGG